MVLILTIISRCYYRGNGNYLLRHSTYYTGTLDYTITSDIEGFVPLKGQITIQNTWNVAPKNTDCIVGNHWWTDSYTFVFAGSFVSLAQLAVRRHAFPHFLLRRKESVLSKLAIYFTNWVMTDFEVGNSLRCRHIGLLRAIILGCLKAHQSARYDKTFGNMVSFSVLWLYCLKLKIKSSFNTILFNL